MSFPCKLNPTVQCLLRPETNLLVTLYFLHFNGTERGKISRKIANLWVTQIGMKVKLSKIFYVDQISQKIWLQWSYDRRMSQSSAEEPCETTALLDSAAARLVKNQISNKLALPSSTCKPASWSWQGKLKQSKFSANRLELARNTTWMRFGGF